MVTFSGDDHDVREAGESAALLGRCSIESHLSAARARAEPLSEVSRSFGPGESEAFSQETWRSNEGDSGTGISSTIILTGTLSLYTMLASWRQDAL